MTAVLLDQVAAYAEAVRSCLADLPSDQIEDLTDGLEADLAEALADASMGGAGQAEETVLDVSRVFGPAEAYAAELRGAAGLEPGAVGRRRPRLDRVRGLWGDGRARLAGALDRMRRNPVGAWTLDLLGSLEPVWWMVRGWIWFVIAVRIIRWHGAVYPGSPLAAYLPRSASGWMLFATLLGLSIIVGRHRRGLLRSIRAVTIVGSAIAVVALPVVVPDAQASLQTALAYPGEAWAEPAEGPDPLATAVVVDGVRATNLFVYDAAGDPVPDAQVFDESGHPVILVPEELRDSSGWTATEFYQRQARTSWLYAAATGVDGERRWNVYPLRGLPSDEVGLTAEGTWATAPELRPETPAPPFARATAIRTPDGELAASSDPADGGPGADANG